jgi:hypothetical protein
MNNLIFYFDGLPQNLDDFNGTQSASFVFRRKTEGGESAFSFAPELTLTGAAYDYVRQQIINAPNPNLAQIIVEVYDTCCTGGTGSPRLLFEGRIEGADVRWCTVPTCQADVTIIDNSQDAEAIRCLKNTFIWDRVQKFDGSGLSDGEDTFRQAGSMQYCNDTRPRAAQEALMIIGIILFILVSPFALIIAFLNLIQGGDPNALYNDLQFLIIDCGKFHKAPFLHSYMRNLCDVCGLNFQSSLFDVNGIYHDTVRLDAAYSEGSQGLGGILDAYEKNKPNLMGNQFLDQFQQLNIDWRVLNGNLIVERKDFFNGVEWFDISTLPESQILSICYDSTGDKPASYAEYLYPKDGIDNSGSETVPNWSQKVFDWNPTNNPIQVGLFSKTFTFGSALFSDDISRTAVSPLDKPFYQNFYNTLQQRGILYLERGISGYPKLIDCDYVQQPVLQPPFNVNVFTARPKFFNNQQNPNLYNYNVVWWVYENPVFDISGNTYNTAYQTLFEIDDPRATTTKTRKVTLSITSDCNLLNTLDVDKYITTPEGQIEIQEITYDTNNNSLTISGLI